MDDIQKLKEVLINGNPMLFLGAGFSYGSKNSYGDMATGNVLKDEIYNTFVKGAIKDSYETEVQQFTLQELCGFVNDHLKKKLELKSYLIKRFQDVEPAAFHYLLSEYPWKKIYTVNMMI